jgi:hypothetical protein
LLDEVVAEVLSEVIITAGRRIATSGRDHVRRRKYNAAFELANGFSTYQLTGKPPESALPAGVSAESITTLLRSDDCHAVLHELLAARMCDAPAKDVAELRTAFMHLGPKGAAPEVVSYLGALFGYYDSEIQALVRQLRKASPETLQGLRTLAYGARFVATLHAINRHVAALAGEPDPAADKDFLDRYRRHVVDYHGKIQPPDFDRRRRLPLDALYVAPDLVELPVEGMAVNWEGTPGADVGLVSVGELADQIDRTVLLGSPGAGKTTTANVLMHRHAVEAGRPVPFMVTLRDFAGTGRSVVGHIEYVLESLHQCPAPAGLVARLLLSGSALVVFDGLDELLDTARRAEVAEIIEQFALEYPQSRVLVTSRLVGYDQARLDDSQFVGYQIGDFDEERVTEYAEKWFALQGLAPDEAARWVAAFSRESANVPDLRKNPLMLALMCILYRGERSLPRSRVGIYEQCAKLLLHRWDAQRDIHAQLRVSYLVEPALRHLADRLLRNEDLHAVYPRRRLIADAAEFLHHRAFESVEESTEAAEEFVDFCSGRAWIFTDVGTTADGEPLYTFTHRTFLEYFAAFHLAVSHDAPEELAATLLPAVAKEQWEVVAELAIMIKDRSCDRGAERAIQALLAEDGLSDKERGHVLTFAARCVASVEFPPQVVRTLTRLSLDHTQIDSHGSREYRIAAGAPLRTLATRCWLGREVVRDQASARITAMIESGDAAVRLAGLELITLFEVISRYTGPFAADPELNDFWEEFVDEVVEEREELIKAASGAEEALRDLAIEHGLLTIGNLVDDYAVDPLKFFDMSWPSPYVPVQLGTRMSRVLYAALGFGRYDEDGRQQARADLAAVGRQLADHWTQPPWDIPEFGWNDPFLFKPSPETSVFQGPEFVGAALSAVVLAEYEFDRRRQGVPPTFSLGPLDALSPYLDQRSVAATGSPLPPLPVPEHIQSALNAWARRELDFIADFPAA